jgi:transcription termination factor Rho
MEQESNETSTPVEAMPRATSQNAPRGRSRADRSERPDRSERNDRSDRGDRSDRNDREQQAPRSDNGDSQPEQNGAQTQPGVQYASGILEILTDGWGFLRHGNFDQGGQDIYVAAAQIKRFNLRTGDTVYGQVRPPKDAEKYYGLLRVDRVNGVDPEIARHRANFEDLVPIYPDERLVLEVDQKLVPPSLLNVRIPAVSPLALST